MSSHSRVPPQTPKASRPASDLLESPTSRQLQLEIVHKIARQKSWPQSSQGSRPLPTPPRTTKSLAEPLKQCYVLIRPPSRSTSLPENRGESPASSSSRASSPSSQTYSPPRRSQLFSPTRSPGSALDSHSPLRSVADLSPLHPERFDVFSPNYILAIESSHQPSSPPPPVPPKSTKRLESSVKKERPAKPRVEIPGRERERAYGEPRIANPYRSSYQMEIDWDYVEQMMINEDDM